jgi:hypothetical protein
VLATPEPDPLLHLPAWGLADQGCSDDATVRSVTEAAALQFAAADLLEADRGADALELARLLGEAAGARLVSSVGDDQGFWETRDATWRRYRALLASSEVDGDELVDADRAVVLHTVVGASVDAIARSGTRVTSALAHAAAARVIERDLARLRADLAAGSTTIATVSARAAADGVDDPELIYPVAASRQVPHRLLDLALRRARLAQEGLAGLPRLSGSVAALAARLGAIRGSLGTAIPAVATHPLPRARRTAGMGRRAAVAVEHARRFLLADPTLAEAREVHRRGGLDRPEMTSTFPLAFPLEALARCGDPVSEQLESWLAELASRSYTYYDDPQLAALDADTVGAVLRLARYRAHGRDASSTTGALLARVSAALAPSDRIPVWLERPTDSRVRLTGGRCAAVEANFLLGLRAGGAELFPELGARPLARLWSDFAARGTTDVADYVPEYLLVPISRLLADGDDPGDAVRARLGWEIERVAETRSPQTAAFLTLAASNHPDMGTVSWSWIETLAGSQRHDGGWGAEPLFWVNGVGGTPEWFRSRTVTTGFCYEALSVFLSAAQAGDPPGPPF